MTSASAAGVLGVAPLSSSARTIRPLVALLKWLTTLRVPPDLVEHPHGGDPAARSAPGRQNAAYVVERRSTTSPLPAASRSDRVEVAAPVRRDDAEPGQVDAAGEPVRRDPVGRADQRRTATR